MKHDRGTPSCATRRVPSSSRSTRSHASVSPWVLDETDRHSPVALADESASLLLVVSATSSNLSDGHWQFAIEAADGAVVMEAEDDEIGDLNRLTLLAAVRGLEAIDGPSRVTLLSHNRYLIRSLTDSLPRWRRSDFVWDHFGRRVEVQHADLWRRIDRALTIHEVQACLLMARWVSRPDDRPLSEVVEGEQGREDDTPSNFDRIDPALSCDRSSVPAPHFHRRPLAETTRPAGASSPPVSAADDRHGKPTDRLRDWLLRSATLSRR